jgi:hypothetical protein
MNKFYKLIFSSDLHCYFIFTNVSTMRCNSVFLCVFFQIWIFTQFYYQYFQFQPFLKRNFTSGHKSKIYYYILLDYEIILNYDDIQLLKPPRGSDSQNQWCQLMIPLEKSIKFRNRILVRFIWSDRFVNVHIPILTPITNFIEFKTWYKKHIAWILFSNHC